MAENTLCRNACLPYPVYGVPWAMALPLIDADGDPTASGAGLDAEISKNADTAADIAGTEVDVGNGQYVLTFTAADMTANIVAGVLKTSTSGLKNTAFSLSPRRLPIIATGTAQGGDTTYCTLAAGTISFDDQFNGMLLVVDIDGTKQARIITDSTQSNQRVTVGDAFTTAPDSDDTYEIMVPEGVHFQPSNAKAISDDATAADVLELFAEALKQDTGQLDDGTFDATGKTGYALSATGLDSVVKMKALLDGTPSGSVIDDNDPDPTTTAFETDLAEASNDHYNGAFCVFYSGALAGQSRKISDYDGTTKVLTVAVAFTEAPAAGDDFLIIGRSE